MSRTSKNSAASDSARSEWEPILIRLSEVPPEEVTYLWFPYLPNGKVSIVQGDGGLGKSWLSLAIATAVTTGSPLPGDPDFGAGKP